MDSFLEDYVGYLLTLDDLNTNDWRILRNFPSGYWTLKKAGVEAFFIDYIEKIKQAPDSVLDDLRKKWDNVHRDDKTPCPVGREQK